MDKRAQRCFLLDMAEALQPAHARVFGAIIEGVGPLSQWPLHTLSQMLSSHLTYQSRLNLTLFLLGNHTHGRSLIVDTFFSEKYLNALQARPRGSQLATS